MQQIRVPRPSVADQGFETILEAAPQLPEGSRIDIFGPLDEYSAEEIESAGMAASTIADVLTQKQVDTTLWDYDCLVLPTYHPGEGYPGVIAEAFAHGLPVITTKWLAIPEIVDDSCGILIEPEDTRAFVAAMSSLHRDSPYWQQAEGRARVSARRSSITRCGRGSSKRSAKQLVRS